MEAECMDGKLEKKTKFFCFSQLGQNQPPSPPPPTLSQVCFLNFLMFNELEIEFEDGEWGSAV